MALAGAINSVGNAATSLTGADGQGLALGANGNGSASGNASADAKHRKASASGSASADGSGNGILGLGNGIQMIGGVPCGPDGKPLTSAQLASLGMAPSGGSAANSGSSASASGGSHSRGETERDPRSHKVPGRDRADRNSGY